MNTSPVISSLHFYPVKSCKAVDLDSAHVGPRGFIVGKILDRSWMLIDENDVLISQRQEPTLARVKVELLDGESGVAEKIQLSTEGMASIVLDPALVGNDKQRVVIHGNESVGHLAPSEVSLWFSDFLGKRVRAVYQKDEDVRLCDPNFAVKPDEDAVSFADGFQYLVTTEATLEKLNGQLESPVPMRRFRPNIVVGNTDPEAEYTWRAITAGEASFDLVKPCTRCVMTTVDQELGVKTGKEPLTALARTTFLAQNFGASRVQGAIFGENAIPSTYGKISVGDAVKVIDTKPMYNFHRIGLPAKL